MAVVWSTESVFVFQVGHEPLPPSVGTTMFGRRVLYLPGFFSYGEWVVIILIIIIIGLHVHWEQLTADGSVCSTVHRESGWKARTLSWPLASYRVQRRLHCGEEQSQTGERCIISTRWRLMVINILYSNTFNRFNCRRKSLFQFFTSLTDFSSVELTWTRCPHSPRGGLSFLNQVLNPNNRSR